MSASTIPATPDPEAHRADGKATPDASTTAVRRDRDSEPRLPNEHDESSDSQKSATPHPVVLQAKKDLDAGRKDTDRAPVTDAVYQRQK